MAYLPITSWLAVSIGPMLFARLIRGQGFGFDCSLQKKLQQSWVDRTHIELHLEKKKNNLKKQRIYDDWEREHGWGCPDQVRKISIFLQYNLLTKKIIHSLNCEKIHSNQKKPLCLLRTSHSMILPFGGFCACPRAAGWGLTKGGRSLTQEEEKGHQPTKPTNIHRRAPAPHPVPRRFTKRATNIRVNFHGPRFRLLQF